MPIIGQARLTVKRVDAAAWLARGERQNRQNGRLPDTVQAWTHDDKEWPMILSWKAPVDYNEKLIGSYDREHGSYETAGSNFDYLALLQGAPYPPGMDRPPVHFKCSKARVLKYDCLWLLGEVPLVSARLAAFLAGACAQDVELLCPAFMMADGELVDVPFYLLNAMHPAQVVDLERSSATMDDDGNVIYFTRTFFRDDALAPRSIAREAQSGDLLIASELAGRLKAESFRGDKNLGFYRAEGNWQPVLEQDAVAQRLTCITAGPASTVSGR